MKKVFGALEKNRFLPVCGGIPLTIFCLVHIKYMMYNMANRTRSQNSLIVNNLLFFHFSFSGPLVNKTETEKQAAEKP